MLTYRCQAMVPLIIIFKQLKLPVRAWKEMEFQLLGIFQPSPTHSGSQGQDRPGLGINGDVCQTAVNRLPAIPRDARTGEKIKPVPLRQPNPLALLETRAK